MVYRLSEINVFCFFVLDAYPTQHLIYKWKSIPGVVVLDKEMAQFYMKKMTTAVQRVDYVAGTFKHQPCYIKRLSYDIWTQNLWI